MDELTGRAASDSMLSGENTHVTTSSGANCELSGRLRMRSRRTGATSDWNSSRLRRRWLAVTPSFGTEVNHFVAKLLVVTTHLVDHLLGTADQRRATVTSVPAGYLVILSTLVAKAAILR